MTWRQPFIVIDQNQLRDPLAITRLLADCHNNGLKMLLPDGAFLEFSKGGLPFETARRSLQILAPHRELVCSARKLTAMVQDEFDRRSPCDTLVHERASEYLRSLLADLERGDESTLRKMIDGPIAKLMPASLEVWNNHAENKRIVTGLLDAIKSDMRADRLKALRQSPERGVSDWLSSADGMRFVFQGLKARGADDPTALELTRSPSVSAGFLSALAGVAVYWIAFGGIDAVQANKLSGDLNDVEYIVVGALAQSLATSDRRASVICRAVSDAFEARRLQLLGSQ